MWIKECLDEEKGESKDNHGCKNFVMDHILNCEKVFQRLAEDANLSFFRREVRIWLARDLGNRLLVWIIWLEAFPIQIECNSGY